MREWGCGFESCWPCSVPIKWHDLLLEMGMGVQWPVGPPPLNFFAIFSEIFCCLHIAFAVGQSSTWQRLCRVSEEKLTAKLALPADICRVLHMTKPLPCSLPCVTRYPVVLAARLDQFFHVLHQGRKVCTTSVEHLYSADVGSTLEIKYILFIRWQAGQQERDVLLSDKRRICINSLR